MKKQFICIKDNLNCGLCVGNYGTLIQWRKKIIEHLEMDDYYNWANDLKYYKIKNDRLIDFICDYLEIEIVEYNKNSNYEIDTELYCELNY